MSLIKIDQTKAAEIEKAKVVAARSAAYIAESDPMFFKAQRGEISLQEWRAKVAEIKTRFPKAE